jgi:hypothetical protein
MIGQAMSQHKKTHVYLGFSHSLTILGKRKKQPPVRQPKRRPQQP